MGRYTMKIMEKLQCTGKAICKYLTDQSEQEKVQMRVHRASREKLTNCAKVLETPFTNRPGIHSALAGKKIIVNTERNFLMRMIIEGSQVWANHVRKMATYADKASTCVGARANLVCNAVLGFPPAELIGTAASLAIGFTARAVTLVAFAAIATSGAAMEAILGIGVVAITGTGLAALGAVLLIASPFLAPALIGNVMKNRQIADLDAKYQKEIESLRKQIEEQNGQIAQLLAEQNSSVYEEAIERLDQEQVA